jgi:uncharacterized protein YhaN
MSLRIHRLDFQPWGCFENLSLAFVRNLGFVDLIEGLNAAGKSTTSRGESALLYGIPVRTPDGHTFDYADLRIGAQLDIDGTATEVVRRKARAGTLLGSDGKPLAQDPIPAALGGMSEEVYRALFQVDHDTLVKGGEELLQGRGEVGASLFAAAAGIVTLHDTLAALDAEAESIFKPRGHATKLHKEIANLRDAEKRLRETTLRPATHRKMKSAVEQAEDACERLSRDIRELEAHARGIERKRATAPLIDDHKGLVAELCDLAAVPELARDATEERISAETAMRTRTDEIERVRKTVTGLSQRIAAIEIDENLIARAAEVRALNAETSVISKAIRDRRKDEGKVQLAEGQLREAVATVGIKAEEVGGLRRPVTARRELDRFLRQHDGISERRRLARERVQNAERQRDDAAQALAEAPPAALDVRALEATVRSTVKAGDLPSKLTEIQAETERLVDGANAALARLHPRPETIDALCHLPTPSREAIERFRSDYVEIRQLEASVDIERQALDVDGRDLDEQREQLRLEGDAPTAEDLDQIRSERYEHWSTLRCALNEGASIGPDAPDAFEDAVAESDRIADARTRDAARVERAAAIQARGVRLELDRAALDGRARSLEARRDALDIRWNEAWAQTGLPAISAHDAPIWIDRYDEILSLAADLRVGLADEQAVTHQIRTHLAALSRRMGEFDIPFDKHLGLNEMLSQAENRISEVREGAALRGTLHAAHQASERELKSAGRELDDAEVAWSDWHAAWPARRSQGGLPDSAEPEHAQEIIRGVEDALAHVARIAELTSKIEGSNDEYMGFADAVEKLCQGVTPDLVDLEPTLAAPTLMTRLSDAEAKRAERAGLDEQLRSAQDQIERLSAQVDDAQAHLGRLLEAANCTDLAELARVERRADRARELREASAKVERQISQVGEGLLDDLLREAAEFDRDVAASELSELRQRIDELGRERDELKEAIGQRKRELEIAEGNVSAVAAAEDVELARARIGELAVDCAKAKLSTAVIRRAIERYRSLHQDPLLRRANELFTRFTYGDYTELFVDLNDKGVAYMVARRHDRVRHDMSQMSTGTREQLFLALRMAAIERYVDISGPVPVLFDDVFLESDEDRSERIFEALGEMARKTQVIVLTHHHHLVAVGKRALGDRLCVQSLPRTAAGLRPAVAA